MKAKRLLSAVLAVCLCAALIPRFALPVWADDPVEYILDRTPELAIFNAYTGSNSEYYEKYMSSWRYNAVAALKFENFSYDTKVGEDKEFYWRGFYKTYIAYLMDRTEHVEINYSNTMHNYEHKHTWGSWPNRKSQTITGQTNSLLYLTQSPDSTQDVDNYYVYYIFPPRSGEYNRVGNAEYTAVQTNINGDNSLWSTINGVSPAGQYLDMAIEFRNVPYYYNGGAKTCTCGGSGKGAAVTFYDGTAPKATVRNTRILKKVDGAIVGETNNFQPGETIVIELGMSEPVRFADKIPNKNTVYIGLLVEDDPVMRYAALTKLENRGPNASERKNTSTLTFEYTVPATQTGLTTITNLDLSAAPSSKSALVHKDADIDLKQMARRDPMTTQYTLLEVAKPNSASSAKGFTKTTSWVTDMAGNALVASNPSVNIYIDCQRPFVAEAVASAEMNNLDVKEDRGVAASDANYRDESDLYMGDGD
ncbi:MAG: hypothetical protein K5981_01890, partial [Clostridia bacterium]|nr:hypothetical protein [Clostridia bacterium]